MLKGLCVLSGALSSIWHVIDVLFKPRVNSSQIDYIPLNQQARAGAGKVTSDLCAWEFAWCKTSMSMRTTEGQGFVYIMAIVLDLMPVKSSCGTVWLNCLISSILVSLQNRLEWSYMQLTNSTMPRLIFNIFKVDSNWNYVSFWATTFAFISSHKDLTCRLLTKKGKVWADIVTVDYVRQRLQG